MHFKLQKEEIYLFYMNYTCALDGIDGYTVSVEADISKGIPNFSIVGLPDISVKESRERIKSAITNSNLKFPNKKIVINLSPSDIRKEGSHFDLAIALCILNNEYDFIKERYEKTAFVGELSLNGRISEVKGVIPFIVNAKLDKKLDRILVPYKNYEEAQVVDNIDIYPVSDIEQVVEYLRGEIELDKLSASKHEYSHEFQLDYADIKGNLVGKRAAEICAGGRHNLLLVGSAGSGKTMIAKRIISIMGELTEEEYLEVSRIYSSAGLFNEDIRRRIRPFRNPHHTATTKSIIGGGQTSTPGEVVLAHNGVLFLDELLEFDKRTLEALRQPIEDKKITITRVKRTNQYPCDFLLIACCNPCPCGNYNNPYKICKCNEYKIKSYLGKASAPLLDRFDLFVEMHTSNLEEVTGDLFGEESNIIRERVIEAHKIQKLRFKDEKILFNDGISPQQIDKYCKLTDDAKEFMHMIFSQNRLSIRSYHKLLRVSRTIADLDNSQDIGLNHLSEAISFRKPLEKYWG